MALIIEKNYSSYPTFQQVNVIARNCLFCLFVYLLGWFVYYLVEWLVGCLVFEFFLECCSKSSILMR